MSIRYDIVKAPSDRLSKFSIQYGESEIFPGGFGVDFSTMPATDEEYQRGVDEVSRRLLSYGVTSYAPTVITSPPEVYARVSLDVLKSCRCIFHDRISCQEDEWRAMWMWVIWA